MSFLSLYKLDPRPMSLCRDSSCFHSIGQSWSDKTEPPG